MTPTRRRLQNAGILVATTPPDLDTPHRDVAKRQPRVGGVGGDRAEVGAKRRRRVGGGGAPVVGAILVVILVLFADDVQSGPRAPQRTDLKERRHNLPSRKERE